MAQFVPDEGLFPNVGGKTVVLTGGATGIGAATVKLLSENGAAVIFGDVNVQAGKALADQHSSTTFVHCDVSQYEELYNLFHIALKQHGKIDHAFSCAGILEQGNWFDPSLTVETVRADHGNTKVVEVNILGTMMFSRIAVPFLKHNVAPGEDRSLTLVSSVNAFRESPGLFIYQTSKHAVHGFLRSSRKILYERDGIRVNAVCPGMTESPMTQNLIQPFKDAGFFWQTSADVSKFVLGILTTTSIFGKAYYIEGGDSWEIEDGLYNTQPQWLGEEPTRRLRANAAATSRIFRQSKFE